ncbi:MAG: HPr family phosphocarrier protein [Actinobacteria bacterium]|nr:HPr family phosphocarrier protein [Actinomycetota bacterium]
MRSVEIKINNKEGLHARPASRLVALCHRFGSAIMISTQEAAADGKNITEVLCLGAEMGDTLTIKIDGKDEARAEKAIKDFFTTGVE